jgi:hypothetical protein
MYPLTRSQEKLKSRCSPVDLSLDFLRKEDMTIKVTGFFVDRSMRDYYSFFFTGIVIPRAHLGQEYCIGFCEQRKDQEHIGQGSIHILREPTKAIWAKAHNLIGDNFKPI